MSIMAIVYPDAVATVACAFSTVWGLVKSQKFSIEDVEKFDNAKLTRETSPTMSMMVIVDPDAVATC